MATAATIEGITVKYRPPFSFINIGQRGKNNDNARALNTSLP